MSPLVKSGSSGRSAAKSSARASAPKSARKQDGSAKGGKKKKIAGAKAIVKKELPGFSRQLSAMLSSGMPIVASLEALRAQMTNPNFQIVIGQVKTGIENGLALSESLKVFPSIFDDLFVNMIRGGESGGQLAETMARIADFLENSAKLRRKVKSAMSYPVAVMCIAFAIVVLMLIFIVPVFQEMFEGMGGQLPAPTQMLVNISELLRHNLFAAILVFGAAVYLFKRWMASPRGAYAMSKFYLKVPVVGELMTKIAMARFARTLSQMIHSGVPILTALDITAGATGNKVIEEAVREGYETVEKGETLSSSLSTKACFSPILVHMLAAGEKTGKVDEMMDNIALFFEDEVDAMLSGLTALIEPLLMVFLGATIGTIVVCMFLPIFKMHELIT
jgi:type IV pilus assembly protein PilC